MNKTQLINTMAKDAHITKTAAACALDSMMDNIMKALKRKEKVQLVGFGTFKVSHRNARTGRNPRTKQPMQIKACKVPTFRAGKPFKDAVNKGK